MPQLYEQKPWLNGIDISVYQGDIDFKALSQTDIKFVIARASCGGELDVRWNNNSSKMKENNIKFGGYHFLSIRDTSISSMKSQAKTFAFALKRGEAVGEDNLPPVMDIESFVQGVPTNKIANLGLAFLEEVESITNKKGMIYTGPGFWHQLQVEDKVMEWYRSRPLWTASYYYPQHHKIPLPIKNWSNPLIWQYSDKGKVPGIKVNVDQNFFFGDESDLENLCKGSSNYVGGTPVYPVSEEKNVCV